MEPRQGCHVANALMQMNTLGYEYRGYFKNSGPPSETKCYEDLEDVVQYLIRATDCTISNIILYVDDHPMRPENEALPPLDVLCM